MPQLEGDRGPGGHRPSGLAVVLWLESQGHSRFGHNVRHALPDGRILVDSYHCSGYNWRTGRLTRESFEAVFRRGQVASRLSLAMSFDAKAFLASLTELPGVYRMLGADERGSLRWQGKKPEETGVLLLPRQPVEPAHRAHGEPDCAASKPPRRVPRRKRCCSKTI